MSTLSFNLRKSILTDRKHACVLKQMCLLKHPGQLKAKDLNWRCDIVGPSLKANSLNVNKNKTRHHHSHHNNNNDKIIINNNNNNKTSNNGDTNTNDDKDDYKIKNRYKTTNQTAVNKEVQKTNITSTNIGISSNKEIKTKNLNSVLRSSQIPNKPLKEESKATKTIVKNSERKSMEFQREHISNSKYFDPVYLQKAAEMMAKYLKTFIKPNDSEKENEAPISPSPFVGSQNISENVKERETSLPISCKRIIRKSTSDITPLDPQVEHLTYLIDCYPSIYVSQSGLINIFLRQGVLLEVTVDKAIRLVDQNQDMAAAVLGKSKACSVLHRSVKICQNKSATDIDLGGIWQAKIRTGHIMVGDRRRTIWFDETGNFGTSEYSKYQFVASGLTDYTVDLLLSSASYGPALVPICKKLVSVAKFECTKIGSVSVQVNDVKVIQKSPGDVIVMAGSKLLKMRPRTQSIEIHTGSTDIAVSPEWGVTCQLRKSLSLSCSNKQLSVSNGNIECRFKRDGQIELRKISDDTP